MRTSESVVKIAAALAKAQAKFPNLRRDTPGDTGGHKYLYATFDQLVAAIRAPLAEHGLAVLQAVDCEAGEQQLVTRLQHESGEFFEWDWTLPKYDKPQSQGSCLAYWCRYQLRSVLCVATGEDDDGQAAQGDKPAERKSAPATPPSNGNGAEAAIVTATAEVMSRKAALKAWAPDVKTVKQAREAVLALVRDVAESTGETEAKKLAEDALALMAQIAAGREADAAEVAQ